MLLTEDQRDDVWGATMRDAARRTDPIVVDKNALRAQVVAIDEIIEDNQATLMAPAIGAGISERQVVELYWRIIAARKEVL